MAQKSREVAVMCWFPSGSKPFPVSIKFRDDNGEIMSVKDIYIKDTIDVFQGKEFKCEAIIGGIKTDFSLMFFSADCRWLLTI